MGLFSPFVRAQAQMQALPMLRRSEVNTTSYVADYLTRSVRRASGFVLVGKPEAIRTNHTKRVSSIVETSQLQCAGLNRHEVEDERALRERSSDPLGLESCAATARDTAKRRQRIGGVGIQLRKDATRTPTSL